MKKSILYILVIALLIRLLAFFDYHEIWWDSAVYIGMGKFIFSLAQNGLWEPLRPIFWPMILGFIWKIRLDPIFFGRLLTLIISLAITYLVYIITKEYYNQTTAIFASILTSFSSVFFFFTFRLYTEIPAVFLVLLSLFFIQKQRYFISGLFIGLAFLTKFPAGMFLFAFLPLMLKKDRIKDTFYYAAGFAVPVIPYLIFNQFMYGNFLEPLLSASYVISKVVGCNYLRYNPQYYYLVLMLKDNFLNIFALAGIIFSAKILDKKDLAILLSFLLPLLYFTNLHCRDMRYFILFLPFLSMISGFGLYSVIQRFKRKRFITIVSVILLFLISAASALHYYLETESTTKIMPRENFYSFAEGKNITGEVWISNPLINLYISKKTELIYYSVYNTEKIHDFEGYISKNQDISYIFLDTCGGGMICSPEDKQCGKATEQLIEKLDKNFNLVYNKTFGRCHYQIFEEK